jgi:hypothetical protein
MHKGHFEIRDLEDYAGNNNVFEPNFLPGHSYGRMDAESGEFREFKKRF